MFSGVALGPRTGDTPPLGVLVDVGVRVGVLVGDSVAVAVGVLVLTVEGLGWTVGTLVAVGVGVGVGTPTEVTLASSQSYTEFLSASTPTLQAVLVQDPASARFAVYVNS